MSSYHNAGSHWNPEEDEQLKNLFSKYGMSIQEISNIHKRTPEAIRLRLVKHNLIKDLNFVKTELIDLEKTKISDGIRENGIVLLTEILSKHISKINERLERIESKVNLLITSSLVNLEELD